MPTGGVNLENIAAFQKAGAVAFGIGSSLFNSRMELNENTLNDLTSKAKQFRKAIS
jgi:2-dehydro-3-deoxyphosphogluconate aldolase/(4S)-4-hydroxy-2-oxoglutarate aldolase